MFLFCFLFSSASYNSLFVLCCLIVYIKQSQERDSNWLKSSCTHSRKRVRLKTKQNKKIVQRIRSMKYFLMNLNGTLRSSVENVRACISCFKSLIHFICHTLQPSFTLSLFISIFFFVFHSISFIEISFPLFLSWLTLHFVHAFRLEKASTHWA